MSHPSQPGTALVVPPIDLFGHLDAQTNLERGREIGFQHK
jgi:hypothetical protein